MSLFVRLLRPILPNALSSRPNAICSLRWLYTRSRQRNVTRSPAGDDLLHLLSFHLRKGHSEYAFARFNHAFDSRRFGYTYRFKIYQKAISTFLYYRNMEGAVAIYSRMRHEGFLPPVGLRAVMDSLLTITKSPSEEAVLEALANAFSLGRARELHLRIVVRLLSPIVSINSNLLDSMVEVFLRSQAEDFTLSDRMKRFIARQHHLRGSFQHAQRWLASMRGRRRADAILMANVGVQPPSDLTQAAGPSVDSLNTLLATQFAHKRNEGAFEIYRLWRSEYPHVFPNTLTFMMLFRALHQGRLAKPRSFRTRRFKNVAPEPTAIPTPRKLFYDMSFCHFSKTSIPTPKFPSKRSTPSLGSFQLSDSASIISPSLLTLAFKVLTSERDYSGAFVCLRTFKLLNFPIRIPLYRILIGSVVRRIQSELPWLHTRPDIQWYWSYRFLGRPPLPIEFDIHLLEGIIRAGERREIALERIYPRMAHDADHPPVQLKGPLPSLSFAAVHHPPLGVPQSQPEAEPVGMNPTPTLALEESPLESQQQLNIPSALEVISAVQPSREDWDFLPLARLLRRAILAAIPEVRTTAAREVCSIIADTKGEMVPPSYSYKTKRDYEKPRGWKKKPKKGT